LASVGTKEHDPGPWRRRSGEPVNDFLDQRFI
jgi:hypothetical protein